MPIQVHLIVKDGQNILSLNAVGQLGLSGFYIEDKTTGDRDPGQELVDELAEKIGEEAIGNFKLTSPGGTVMTFRGSVEPGDIGGGKTTLRVGELPLL